MRTTDWDAVLASAPTNADAARAMVYGYAEEEPLPLERARKEIRAEHSRDPNFRNWIGHVKGWLRVVAYGGPRIPNAKARGKTGGNQGARWIVRCICGRYEFRTTKALRPQCPNDRCNDCERLQYLQRVHRGEVAA